MHRDDYTTTITSSAQILKLCFKFQPFDILLNTQRLNSDLIKKSRTSYELFFEKLIKYQPSGFLELLKDLFLATSYLYNRNNQY